MFNDREKPKHCSRRQTVQDRVLLFALNAHLSLDDEIEVFTRGIFLDDDTGGGVVFDGGGRRHGAKLIRGDIRKEG